MAPPSNSCMMAGSEIANGSSLMSSQLHTWGKTKPIFLLSSFLQAVKAQYSLALSHAPHSRSALNSVASEPS